MQSADLSSNFFKLFGLPVQFDMDTASLTQRYRELQWAVHPDKFANAPDSERRLSVQMAARINEGFQTLKNPLARARYLLEQKGMAMDEQNTGLDNMFLMEQMELREAMEAVQSAPDPEASLQQVAQDIASRSKALMEELAQLFHQGDDESLQQAQTIVHKLQFFHRLEDEVAGLEDDLAGH
jgi:molecular chaperone HscB